MRRWFQVTISLGLLVVLTGCMAMRPGRTEPTGITLVKVPTSIASVVKAEASIEDGQLVVAGNLRRMHEVKFPGHIDISVCGPEGLLGKKSVTVPGLSSKRKGTMNLPFSTHFSLIPPPGSKVTVRYHAPPFGDEKVLKCL